MHFKKIGLLSILALLSNTTFGMENQPGQQVLSLREILNKACEEKTLNENEFKQLIQESKEFTSAKNELNPQKLGKLLKDITQLTTATHGILSKEYINTFAPRTAIAFISCGILSCLKPYAFGWLDGIPTEEATVIFAAFWAAELKERTDLRDRSNNGLHAVYLIQHATNKTFLKKIHRLQEKNEKSILMDEKIKKDK